MAEPLEPMTTHQALVEYRKDRRDYHVTTHVRGACECGWTGPWHRVEWPKGFLQAQQDANRHVKGDGHEPTSGHQG